MTIANISQVSARGLPQTLITAQQAIHLPEVQEMLRRLSEYKLGIFMPHMHDEQKGEFRPLPDEVMQVESGLEVSFQAAEEIVNQTDRFLPWDGFCVPVHRHHRQCAKWFGKKDRAIQSATVNIRCLKESSI